MRVFLEWGASLRTFLCPLFNCFHKLAHKKAKSVAYFFPECVWNRTPSFFSGLPQPQSRPEMTCKHTSQLGKRRLSSGRSRCAGPWDGVGWGTVWARERGFSKSAGLLSTSVSSEIWSSTVFAMLSPFNRQSPHPICFYTGVNFEKPQASLCLEINEDDNAGWDPSSVHFIASL